MVCCLCDDASGWDVNYRYVEKINPQPGRRPATGLRAKGLARLHCSIAPNLRRLHIPDEFLRRFL